MSIVTVIYNPQSGGSVGVEDLEAAFADHRHAHTVRWSPTTEEDPGPGQAREAMEAGSETVIAAGGDGTVRAVAAELAGTATQLGVVPLGTGNLLAANLEIPTGLDAVPAALSASPTTLDVGSVNGERFLVMAGVGFDAAMIRDANSTLKDKVGSAAYVLSGAKNVPAEVVTATVTVDGDEVFDGETAMVLIGNCGAVTGGLPVFPDASPSDGHLDIAVLLADNARDWARTMWRLVRGKEQDGDDVMRFTGRDIVVQLDRPMPYELDGEARDEALTLTFSIEPHALEVRCP